MTEQTYEFQTETARLLELMIHSLYSNHDVFLRELISNASDALDKRHFAGLTDDRIVASSEAKLSLTRSIKPVLHTWQGSTRAES